MDSLLARGDIRNIKVSLRLLNYAKSARICTTIAYSIAVLK